MWPLFHVSNTVSPSSAQPRQPLAFAELVARIGDFKDFGYDDTTLKFWLPDPAEQALDEMGQRNGLNKSEFLRQFFVLHCYGLYAFYAMKDTYPRLFKDAQFLCQSAIPEPLLPGKKRIDTYWVPELGKNIAPIKVWLPKRLRDDLASLARHANLTLSNYTREIVITHLFGQGMLPTRPEMFQVSATSQAEDWIEGRDVPWREVTKEETIKHFIFEIRPKVVNEDYQTNIGQN